MHIAAQIYIKNRDYCQRNNLYVKRTYTVIIAKKIKQLSTKRKRQDKPAFLLLIKLSKTNKLALPVKHFWMTL